MGRNIFVISRLIDGSGWGGVPPFISHQSLWLKKGSLLEFIESLPEFFLRVHYDGTVPCDGLLERSSRDEEEPDSIVPCLNRDLVAPVK